VRKPEELRRDFEDVFGPLEQVQTHRATYLKRLAKK
jgi:hypothetical protein